MRPHYLDVPRPFPYIALAPFSHETASADLASIEVPDCGPPSLATATVAVQTKAWG